MVGVAVAIVQSIETKRGLSLQLRRDVVRQVVSGVESIIDRVAKLEGVLQAFWQAPNGAPDPDSHVKLRRAYEKLEGNVHSFSMLQALVDRDSAISEWITDLSRRSDIVSSAAYNACVIADNPRDRVMTRRQYLNFLDNESTVLADGFTVFAEAATGGFRGDDAMKLASMTLASARANLTAGAVDARPLATRVRTSHR